MLKSDLILPFLGNLLTHFLKSSLCLRIQVCTSIQFNSVTQSCLTLLTPWTAACQASLSITTPVDCSNSCPSFGEGNGNPLHYSCLENPMDRGAWWAAVYGVTQSQTWLKRLSMHTYLGEGNGNPLQYCCLENPRDRGAWLAAVYGVTQSRTWLKRLSSSSMSFKTVMPSHHLILCLPFLLLPSIFPSIRVFSNESVFRIRWPTYWSFSVNISPSNEYSGLISFRMDWLDLLAVQGTLKSPLQHRSSKASILHH